MHAELTQPPKPGIYYDVPAEVYHAWNAVSNSRMATARQSLLHYNEAAPIEETKSMRIGTFLHCGILEPLAIQERYAVIPAYELDSDNCTKDGKPSQSTATDYYKQQKQKFLDANKNKTLVTEKEYRMLVTISKRVRNNPRCRLWLNGASTEVSIVWVDAETQVTCKARLDAVSSVIPDLKSCQSVAAFPKSIATYGYHRQAAHYRNGWGHLTGDVLPVGFIAVETSHPFPVVAAPMSESAIETGDSEVRETLRAIADAHESGEWPGPKEPESWCLPSWYSSDKESVELVIDGQKITI